MLGPRAKSKARPPGLSPLTPAMGAFVVLIPLLAHRGPAVGNEVNRAADSKGKGTSSSCQTVSCT